MIKLLKRIFKKKETTTVYKGGKVYKFSSFKKAVAFMQKGYSKK